MSEKLDSHQAWAPGEMLLDDIERVDMRFNHTVWFSTKPGWGNRYPSELAKDSVKEADEAILKAMGVNKSRNNK